MDDEIDLQINLQSDMVPLYCLPDSHISEQSTMTTSDKEVNCDRLSTVIASNLHFPKTFTEDILAIAGWLISSQHSELTEQTFPSFESLL